jgi:hypothetical protein
VLTDAELSRLMFAARDTIDEYVELVSERGDFIAAKGALNLRDEIDAYRVSRGWQLNGFGGE